MKLLSYSTAASICSLAATIHAIDVAFSPNPNCEHAIVTCSNIIQLACCAVPDALLGVVAAKFTDMTPLPTYFGTAFRNTGGKSHCNTPCRSVAGSDAAQHPCVRCSHTVTGASWDKRGKRKRAEASESCVQPDVAHIDGSDFKIFYDVPAHVTAGLLDLAMNQTNLADVPLEYFKYKI